MSIAVRRHDIVNQPIGSQLIKLTIPMLYAIFAIMGLGIVDSYFISLLGTQELAAMGFVAPITAIVQNIGLAIGMAVSSLNSKLIGANQKKDAVHLVTHGFYLTTIIALCVMLTLFWQLENIFRIIGAHQDTLLHIKHYMQYWILATPFLLLTMVCSSTFRSIGDTNSSARISITLTIVNLILDPILIFGFGPIPAMGVSGAALATLIALLLSSYIGMKRLAVVEKLLTKTLPTRQALRLSLKKLLQIAIPAILANALVPITTALLTTIIATFGTHAVAGFGVGMRLEAMLLIVIYALSSTLPMFIGQNLGANKPQRVYQASHLTFKFVLAFYFLIYFVLLFFAPSIAHVFSKNQEVIQVIQWFLWIVPLSYGLIGIVILVNVSVNVLGNPRHALIINLLRLFAFYLPICLIGAKLFAVKGVFIGMIIGNLATCIMAYYFLRKNFQQMNINA